MSTIEALRKEARWNRTKLAREADLNYLTVVNAETGKPVQLITVEKIAAALSSGLGRSVSVRELEQVNIIGA
jgi:DNA-binding XRE family transcriptional regulator